MEIRRISSLGETAASGSSQPRSPGRPRRQESEDAILNAVMLILASDGYTGLTTDKIAALARVSKSTIYRRWPTKEHMVLAAFGHRRSNRRIPAIWNGICSTSSNSSCSFC